MKRYTIVAASKKHFESLIQTYKKDFVPITTTPRIWELENKDQDEFITILTPKAAKDLGI